MTDHAEKKRRHIGRLKVLALLGVFLAPVALAYLLFNMGWRPDSTVNYGDLVVPARPIGDVRLQTLAGRPLKFSALRGNWTLVYFGPAECPSVCEKNLYKMQQVQLAQGREAHRVQRLFVVTGSQALDVMRYKIKDYPGTRLATGPSDVVRAWRRQFTATRDESGAAPDRVFLVDPLGNLVLSYPADADASGMRKDLVRLLRVSQIG